MIYSFIHYFLFTLQWSCFASQTKQEFSMALLRNSTDLCLLHSVAGNDGKQSTEKSKERYMSILCTPIPSTSSAHPSGNPNTSQSENCNNCHAIWATFALKSHKFLVSFCESFCFILPLNQFIPSHLLTSPPSTLWGSQRRTGKQSAPTSVCHFGITHSA